MAGFTTIAPTSPSGTGGGIVGGGGTTFTGAGSRIIYVANAGSDVTGDGTLALPYKTIAVAVTRLRTGFPDQMLLNRGDTFTNDIMGSPHLNGLPASGSYRGGNTVTGPILFGTYGTGARPIIRISPAAVGATNYFFDSFGGGGGGGFYNNLAFIGWDFYCYTRDPTIGGYSTTDANSRYIFFNLVASIGPYGWLWEDCIFRFAGDAIIVEAPDSHDLTIRRCIIVDQWCLTAPSAGNVHIGIYFGDTTVGGLGGFLVEDSFFDHNGWNANAGVPSILNHNIYIHDMSGPNITLQNSISIRASLAGCQMRVGGTLYNNFFGQNSAVGNAGPGSFTYNVISEACDRPGIIDQGGTPVSGGTGVEGAGWQINPTTVGNPGGGPVTVDHNIACNTISAAATNAAFSLLSGVNTYTVASVAFTNNIIFKMGAADFSVQPNAIGTNTGNYTDTTGSNSGSAPEPFPAPTRTLSSYAGSIGLTASYDGFSAACRARALGVWDTRLTAAAVNSYIRAGFNMADPVTGAQIIPIGFSVGQSSAKTLVKMIGY